MLKKKKNNNNNNHARGGRCSGVAELRALYIVDSSLPSTTWISR
jgi:hypothetical protein